MTKSQLIERIAHKQSHLVDRYVARWSRWATGTAADLLGVAPLDGTRWRAAWVARDGTAYAVGDSGTVRKRLP